MMVMRLFLLLSLLHAACGFYAAPALLRIADSHTRSLSSCTSPGLPHLGCVKPSRKPRDTSPKMIDLGGVLFGSPEFGTFPQTVFSIVNFVVLPFWAMMIAAPNNELTQKLMKSSIPILLGAAMHLALVIYGPAHDPAGALSELKLLGTQGFVQLTAMQEMRQFPDFVSEEWVHVLTWDLFVGRYVYLDGLEKKIPTWHSLFFTFFLGPLGFTMHVITRAIVTKDASSILKL